MKNFLALLIVASFVACVVQPVHNSVIGTPEPVLHPDTPLCESSNGHEACETEEGDVIPEEKSDVVDQGTPSKSLTSFLGRPLSEDEISELNTRGVPDCDTSDKGEICIQDVTNRLVEKK